MKTAVVDSSSMLPAVFHDFGGIRKELCDKAIEPHFKVLCDAEKQEGNSSRFTRKAKQLFLQRV